MKSNKLAIAALLLWVITIAVFAWFFIRGNTTAGTDGRTAIVLQPAERDFVMKEMRGLLAATQEIMDAGSQNDTQRIVKAARGAGMAGAADVNPALMVNLPVEFKKLGARLRGQTVVLIVSGCNITREQLTRVLTDPHPW